MFTELQNTKKKTEQERQENEFWDEYKRSRSELFEVFPEDVAKTYVFANYKDQLYNVDDPFGLVDSILQPKVAKIKRPIEAKTAAPEVPVSLGTGKAPAPAKKSREEDEIADKGRKALMEAMGFKS
jgi:hypothetical protein